MNKINVFLLIGLLILGVIGCSKVDDGYDLDMEKVKKLAVDEASFFSDGEVELTKICKSTLKDSSNFSGEYLIFFVSDKSDKTKVLHLDDEMEIMFISGYNPYEIYDNDCQDL